MPSGSGRKGGVPKRKRIKAQPVQSQSVRKCLQSQSSASTKPTTSPITSQAISSSSDISQLTNSGQPNACAQFDASVSHSPSVNGAVSSAHSLSPTTAAFGSTLGHYNRPVQHQVGGLSNATITPTASSHSQVLVGSNVFNFAASPMSVVTRSNQPVSNTEYESSIKPLVLKMKTNHIRVCQSCRKDYSGPNDTMGLRVAQAERRLVSNLVTGTQFLGRESNSHYHLHMACINRL